MATYKTSIFDSSFIWMGRMDNAREIWIAADKEMIRKIKNQIQDLHVSKPNLMHQFSV